MSGAPPFCVHGLGADGSRWQASKAAWAECRTDELLLHEQEAIEAELQAEAASMDASRKAAEAATRAASASTDAAAHTIDVTSFVTAAVQDAMAQATVALQSQESSKNNHE